MFKNLKYFTFFYSVILVWLHSPVLLAEDLSLTQSRAVIFVPFDLWAGKISQMGSESHFDISKEFPEFNYNSQDAMINISSKNIELNVKMDVSNITLNQQKDFESQLLLKSATARLKNFNLAVIIKKDTGFGNANLRLNIQCAAINLKISNENKLKISTQLQNGLFQVNSLGWDLSQSLIQTELIQCTDVPGFEKIFNEQIQLILQKEVVLKYLQTYINSEINKLIEQKLNDVVSLWITKYQSSAFIQHHFDQNRNLWFYSKIEDLQTVKPEIIDQLMQSKKIAMLVNIDNLKTTIKDNINTYFKKNVMSSKNISALDSLTCSRFWQTFVWPALKTFNRCFEMRIQNEISELKILDINQRVFEFKMNSWVSAENRNIALFQSVISADFKNASSRLLTFNAQSNPEFIQWSGRSSRISQSMMRPSVEGFIQQIISNLAQSEIFKLIDEKSNSKKLDESYFIFELNSF